MPIQLTKEDLQYIGEYVQSNMATWIATQSLGKPPVVYEIELRERLVRVEEELKHQRELMRQGFELMDKRNLELREDINHRFEAVDKRFEAVDKRFEAMDKRFEYLIQRFEAMDKRFEYLIQRFEVVEKRFEAMDKRFEYLIQRFEVVEKRFEAMDKRFEVVDKRFEALDRRFDTLTRRIDRFMIWSFGLTVTMAATIISVLKYWQ